jgi:hypothetical protein
MRNVTPCRRFLSCMVKLGLVLKVLNFEAYKISALSVADFYKLSNDSSTSIQEFLPNRATTNVSRRTLLLEIISYKLVILLDPL